MESVHVEGNQGGGEHFNEAFLPLGATTGDDKDTLHSPHIIDTLVDAGGEAIGVLHRGGLQAKEGQVEPSVLLNGHHLGDIVGIRAYLLALLIRQLNKYKVPRLNKDKKGHMK